MKKYIIVNEDSLVTGALVLNDAVEKNGYVEMEHIDYDWIARLYDGNSFSAEKYHYDESGKLVFE